MSRFDAATNWSYVVSALVSVLTTRPSDLNQKAYVILKDVERCGNGKLPALGAEWTRGLAPRLQAPPLQETHLNTSPHIEPSASCILSWSSSSPRTYASPTVASASSSTETLSYAGDATCTMLYVATKIETASLRSSVSSTADAAENISFGAVLERLCKVAEVSAGVRPRPGRAHVVQQDSQKRVLYCQRRERADFEQARRHPARRRLGESSLAWGLGREESHESDNLLQEQPELASTPATSRLPKAVDPARTKEAAA